MKQNLPKIGDVITGFVIPQRDTMHSGGCRETRVTDRYVVEAVARQPDGYGHGPHDVYPGGHKLDARLLKEDDSYDPEGALLHPLVGAGGSWGNNNHIEVVGHMRRVMTFEPQTDVSDEPKSPSTFGPR